LDVPAVISLASAKGGCAKTTTALALGLELALDGARVTVLDADPNQHAAEFGATFARTKQALPEGAGFAVASHITEDSILSEIRTARAGADFVIVDLPGIAAKLTLLGLTRSDLVIVPVQPSKMDARDALRTIKDIEQASETVGWEIPYRVLLARWPVLTETVVARHTRGELAKKSVPVLATPFMDRTAWKEMVYSGRCPRVVGADSNAAHNLTAITREVLTVLADRAAEVAA
jgi:chromosome partitioning protein